MRSQSSLPSPLQAGQARYQAGDFAGAIQIWQAGLQDSLALPGAATSPAPIALLKHLVRAHQQLGQTVLAITDLERLVTLYKALDNRIEMGHMLTETAQLYSSLGQHNRAIALLCGKDRKSGSDPKTEVGKAVIPAPSPTASSPAATGPPLSVNADRGCAAESAVAIAQHAQDILGQSAAIGALGNTYRLQGRYELALQLLQDSLALSNAGAAQSGPANPGPANPGPANPGNTAAMAALSGLGQTYAYLAQYEYHRAQLVTQDVTTARQLRQAAQHYDRLAIQRFTQSANLAQSQKDLNNEVRLRLQLLPLYARSRTIANAVPNPTGPNAVPNTTGPNTTGPNTTGPTNITAPAIAAPNLAPVLDLINQLPDTPNKAYALVRLAKFTPWPTATPENLDWTMHPDWTTHCVAQPTQQTLDLLNRAKSIAQATQDASTLTFVAGNIGHVYECQKDYDRALYWTQKAQLSGQIQENPYLWHWQAARIFKQQGNLTSAFAAYEVAVRSLPNIQGGLAIVGSDVPVDVRNHAERLYREFVELQLDQAIASHPESAPHPESAAAPTDPQAAPSAPLPLLPLASSLSSPLNAALETLDHLHVVELQNYLGDDCTLEPVVKPIALIDQKTAVLSSILFRDRVALILTRPDASHHTRSRMHWLTVPPTTVTAKVNQLRLQLEKRSDLANNYRQPAQQLYDWLIRPFLADLTDIETLVFIQDGILRSIPMAALYDGHQFLMQQYAVANTLSLTLINPTHMDHNQLRVAAFGLTQPARIEGDVAFDRLTYVTTEIQRIIATLPGSRGLFDGDFTRDRLQQELQRTNTPIIHLATHGKFGIDSRDSFLVTGNRITPSALASQPENHPVAADKNVPKDFYNETITMNQLYDMIRQRQSNNPVELLTLTACETAVGSDRDALGLAGISLQAGARSAVASLWQVDDQATSTLITDFYRALQTGQSRAKALQHAQIHWLQQHPDSHPGYWAALILVGNWL